MTLFQLCSTLLSGLIRFQDQLAERGQFSVSSLMILFKPLNAGLQWQISNWTCKANELSFTVFRRLSFSTKACFSTASSFLISCNELLFVTRGIVFRISHALVGLTYSEWISTWKKITSSLSTTNIFAAMVNRYFSQKNLFHNHENKMYNLLDLLTVAQ